MSDEEDTAKPCQHLPSISGVPSNAIVVDNALIAFGKEQTSSPFTYNNSFSTMDSFEYLVFGCSTVQDQSVC